MRRSLAGLIFLGLLLGAHSLAWAQATGDVESVGFNNYYRPNCWTPMVVRLLADKSGTYQIKVVQEDVDADRAEFTRTVTVTGIDEGATTPQPYRMYFIPQPTNGGLYDVNRGGTTQELSQQLRVFLCDAEGRQLMKLPISQTIINLEPQAPPFSMMRGMKLILSIAEGGGSPVTREYQDALGLLESVAFVGLQPRDLPENSIGYEAVDSILWLNAPIPDISNPTEDQRMRAIQQWVRQGGHLVICQPAQRDATLAWGDMLPVVVEEIGERSSPEPLMTFVSEGVLDQRRAEAQRIWGSLQGPFRIARATAKPGTLVDHAVAWDDEGKDQTPYIARMPYGLGCVTWVAQDLSDPVITARAKVGWPHIWDKVFDWRNDTLIVDNRTPAEAKTEYAPASMRDLGVSMREGMAMAGKSRAYIGLAIVFFIVYWLIAGPGLYVYLAAKARAHMSWFLFAASAVVATALTVLVVQLLVRGKPELQHITVVRQAAGENAVIQSRFGLYVKNDGLQRIALQGTDPAAESYITAFADHPEHIPEGGAPAPARMRYTVPIHESGSGDPIAVDIPYRSTLKKLQSKWVGPYTASIAGSGTVSYTDYDNRLSGTITNGTGFKLKNIYIAYKPPRFSDQYQRDQILYLPSWEPGVSLDLAKEWAVNGAALQLGDPTLPQRDDDTFGLPTEGKSVKGWIYVEQSWPLYWYSGLRSGNMGMDSLMVDDHTDAVPKSVPMLSFFDRLPPARGDKRFELLRRGARYVDMSSAVAAGELVVLAEAENVGLPMPLEVAGDSIEGIGTTYYQFALPLEYVQVDDSGQAVEKASATASSVSPEVLSVEK